MKRKKSIFDQLQTPELTDQLAKYAPSGKERDKILARSEQKFRSLNAQYDEVQESEVISVKEYQRSRKFAPFISLAACAVLVAGIGSIYALKTNQPPEDMTPGSADTQSVQNAVAPFGDITGLDLRFFESDTTSPSDDFFTISEEQQNSLAAALNAFSWVKVKAEDVYPPLGSEPLMQETIGMQIADSDKPAYEQPFVNVYFYLDAGIIRWTFIKEMPDCKPQPMTNYYYMDETLIGCIRDIVKNNILTPYKTDTVEDAQNSLINTDLNESELFFIIPDKYEQGYYSISEEKQAELAVYIANQDGWRTYEEQEDSHMTGGDRMMMFVSSQGRKSIVSFYSDGMMIQKFLDEDVSYWWTATRAMYNQIWEIIATPEECYPLPYHTADGALRNPDNTMRNIYDEAIPINDISTGRIRLMSAAYAPLLIEISETVQQELAGELNSVIWREIISGAPEPDGEYVTLYAFNQGSPFALYFYGDGTIRWTDGYMEKIYRTSRNLYGQVQSAVQNYQYEDSELNVMFEASGTNSDIMGVWETIEEEAAKIDLSAYAEMIAKFNSEYRTTMHLVTKEDCDLGRGLSYADAVEHTLQKTPEELYDELVKNYESNPETYLYMMPYLNPEKEVQIYWSDNPDASITLSEEQMQTFREMVNSYVWTTMDNITAGETFANLTAPMLVIVYQNDDETHTLSICPEENIAEWKGESTETVVSANGDEQYPQMTSYGYFELWQELTDYIQTFPNTNE